MRMSCNGCRVLRKGCSPDCPLKLCLQWIASPESQANATLFLAKFYGRAGLINLINAGPANMQPQIFRSLLYEACGRIIDPVNGSVGIMCAGEWARCQAAVEAVMQGSTIMTQISGYEVSASAAEIHGCDIRHISKGAAGDRNRIRIRNRFKRTANAKRIEEKFTFTGWKLGGGDYEKYAPEVKRASSQDDALSDETVEPSLVNRAEQLIPGVKREPYPCDIGLELTLGLNTANQSYKSAVRDF